MAPRSYLCVAPSTTSSDPLNVSVMGPPPAIWLEKRSSRIFVFSAMRGSYPNGQQQERYQ
jgi:hypothetical protein